MGNSIPLYHQDHIAGKGKFITAPQFGSQIYSMPQAMKNAAAKAAVDKEWEKLETISAWNLTSQN